MAGQSQATNLSSQINQLASSFKTPDMTGLNRAVGNTFRPDLGANPTEADYNRLADWQMGMGRASEAAVTTGMMKQAAAERAAAATAAREEAGFRGQQDLAQAVPGMLGEALKNGRYEDVLRAEQFVNRDLQQARPGPGSTVEERQLFEDTQKTAQEAVKQARTKNEATTVNEFMRLNERMQDPTDPLYNNPQAQAAIRSAQERQFAQRPELGEKYNKAVVDKAKLQKAQRDNQSAANQQQADVVLTNYSQGHIDDERAATLLRQMGTPEALDTLDTVEKVQGFFDGKAAEKVTQANIENQSKGVEKTIASLKATGFDTSVYEEQLKEAKNLASAGVALTTGQAAENLSNLRKDVVTQYARVQQGQQAQRRSLESNYLRDRSTVQSRMYNQADIDRAKAQGWITPDLSREEAQEVLRREELARIDSEYNQSRLLVGGDEKTASVIAALQGYASNGK